MAKTQTAHIVITANAKAAVEVMKMLRQQTDDYINRLDTLKQKKQQGVLLTKAEEKEARELEKKIQALTTAQQKSQAAYRQTRDVMKNIAGSTTKDLKRAYGELAKMLNNTTGEQTWRQEVLRKKMQEVKAQIDKNTGAINSMSKAQSGFGGALKTTLKNLVAYAGVFALFNKIKSTLTDLVKKNLEFSDELTNIRKVSQLTEQDINELAVGLAKIDTRSTVNELNNLAYAGAKLGIGKWGTEGLRQFVVAADKVNVALKEDLGDDALTAMSKLVEVMGLIPKMGIEKSMEAAGSAIFMLSTSSTATGANIIEFSKRLMGLANVSHVAVDQLLALGSASDAMGLMPEVSATAFNKVFTSVQTNTRGIAKALGDTNGELQALIDKGQTMEGIVYVLDKMHTMSVEEMKGRGLFKELGSDGARLNNVIATMANRVEMLKAHLDISNEAFVEATAIQKEYEMQMESAQGYMERASNIWTKEFVNPEGVDVVKQMAVEWYNVSKSMTESESKMASIKMTLGMLANLIKVIIKLLPELIRLMMFYGLAQILKRIYLGYVSIRTVIDATYVAQGRLNRAMKSNAILFAISAGVTLATTLLNVSEAEDKVAEKQEENNEKLKEAARIYKESSSRLQDYVEAVDNATLSEKERNRLIQKFKNEFGGYLNKLNIEINTAKDLKDAYASVNEELRKKAFYEMSQKEMEEVVNPMLEQHIKTGQEVQEYLKENKLDLVLPLSTINEILTKGGIDALRKRYHALETGLDESSIRPYSYEDHVYDPETGREMAITNRYIRGTNSQGKTVEMRGDWVMDSAGSALERFANESELINSTREAILKKYKPFVGDYDPVIQELLAETSNYEPGPTKEEENAAKEALRKDLKDAKTDSDAIIAKIEEWYRLQETVITDMQADGKLTKEQADQAVRTLNIDKHTALRDARLSISGRNTEAWETTKQQIGNLMLDQGEWSQELLGQILGVSMESIRANLAKIDKGGGKYGITTTSLKDSIDKNAAGNQREIARLMARAQQEVEKIFMEYDFFEQAMQGFSNRLAQMGILSETASQMAERLSDAKNPDTLFSMKDYDALLKGNEGAKQQMLQAFIRSGATPYGVNPEDKEQLRTWFVEFVGSYQDTQRPRSHDESPETQYQYHSWAKPFEQDFEKWLRAKDDKYLPSIQSFYLSLMKSEEDYYEKRKQSYNHYKKQLDQKDQAAGIPTQREDKERQLQTQATLQDNGIGASFWRQQGLGGILNDPEVMLIQQRIEWRNQDLESAKALLEGKEKLWAKEKEQRMANGESEADIDADLAQKRMGFEDLIKERQTSLFEQQMNLTTKIAQEMRKRVQTVNNLTKPIQDGALNIGKKFGEMLAGVEEQSMTWKEIWHSMAVAVGESVIDMTAQYAQNLIMEKAMNTQSKQEAIDKANVDVAAGTASGAAKTIGTLGWWGIALIPVIAALLKGLLQAAFASNKSSDTATSSSNIKTKLVSGMLTYDEGNINSVSTDSVSTGSPSGNIGSVSAGSPSGNIGSVSAGSPSGKRRYLGEDGKVYTATAQSSLPAGVSVVRHPIATTVNGHNALVPSVAQRSSSVAVPPATSR